MRKLIAVLAVLLLLLTSAASLFAQERPTLIELLENDSDGRFTTLLAAIDAAGLADALSGSGPYTVLAPTDDAFAAALDPLGLTPEDVLADTATLTQILRAHVIPGHYTYRNLTGGVTLGTALAGQSVTFALDGGLLLANGIEVSETDKLASNGVIHVIEGVLVPPAAADALAATEEPTPEPTAVPTEEPTAEPTEEATPVVGVAPERPNLVELLENDSDGRFTTLLAVLGATGMNTPLGNSGPYTLLAPTDDAFAAALDALGLTLDDLLANRVAVNQIVLYHILRGTNQYRTLTGGATLPTMLLGQSVTFALDGGLLLANDIEVSETDKLASNGVIHVIEGVLVPPAAADALAATEEPTPEPTAVPTEEPTAEPTEEPTPVVGVAPERPNLVELLENDSDGRFTTLLAVLGATGMNTPLGNSGPYTLLAPTDDAFAAALDALGLTLDDLLANRVAVNQIALYHILRGTNQYRTLTGGATLPTMLLGQSVTFALDGGLLLANGIEVSETDKLASNGVIHVIEGVLVPPAAADALAATEEPTPEPTAVPTEEPTAVVGVAPERPNLVELLENDSDGRFTTLLAVIAASGQTDTLSSGGPFTLLAPTDDAFAALLDQFGMTPEQALANPSVVAPILLYHVIPGRYPYRNLTGGATLDTLLPDQSVTFALESGVLTVQGVEVSETDKLASNGLVQVVEGVLLPPAVQALIPTPEPTAVPTEEPTPEPTPEVTPVVGVAPERPSLTALLTDDSDGRFTTLLAAIDAAGLTETLDGAGPYTVLAPTNDAFDALFAETGLSLDQLAADPTTLGQILRYHVIPGRYSYRNLTGGATLSTALAGQRVTFALDGGLLLANGIEVSETDKLASNGLAQVVEGVLLPPAVQEMLMSNPHLRVAHFSPDGGSVDVYINGALSSLTGVAFPDVSAWMNVAPGSYEIGIAPAGGDPALTMSVDLAEGDWVLVAVTGSLSQGTLRANAIVEDFSPLADDTARLSMFNGVEGSPAYNVTVDGSAAVIRLGYPGTLGDNDGYYSADVPAGTYTVQFVVTDLPSQVVINLPDVTLEAGNSYLIVAAGSPAAPGAVIVPSAVPAP